MEARGRHAAARTLDSRAAPPIPWRDGRSFRARPCWQFFGTKPELVLKGGTVAYSQMGDANASIPTPQPVVMRPMWGAMGKAAGGTSIAFVSSAAAAAGVKEAYGLTKAVEPVRG